MKNSLRFPLLFALALALGLGLAACSPGGKSLVGKWKVDRQDVVVTFTTDGKMITQSGGHDEEADYSVSDGMLYVKPKEMPMSLGYKMAFTSDSEMVLTPQPGRAGQSVDTTPMNLV